MTDLETDSAVYEHILSTLNNDVRRQILQELYHSIDWQTRPSKDQGLAFSELQKRVDSPDSGTFTYHLDQLVGEFVRKSDRRYHPVRARIHAVHRILAWSGTDSEIRGPVDTDYDCGRCSATLELRYRDQMLDLRCTLEDEGPQYLFAVPFGATSGRDLEALVPIALARYNYQINCLRNSTCPVCYGVLDTKVQITRRLPGPDGEFLPLADVDVVDDDDGVRFAFSCSQCGGPRFWTSVPISRFAMFSPEGRAFMRRHGLDPLRVPKVHSLWTEYNDTGLVVSQDPVRLETTLKVEDDTVTFTFCDDPTIRAVIQQMDSAVFSRPRNE